MVWEGGREGPGQVPTDPRVSVLESESEQYLQACAGLKAREGGSPSLGRRKGLRLAQQRLRFLAVACLVFPGCRSGQWAVAFPLWHCSLAGISGRKSTSSERKVFLPYCVIQVFL